VDLENKGQNQENGDKVQEVRREQMQVVSQSLRNLFSLNCLLFEACCEMTAPSVTTLTLEIFSY
jgi:hypothetical protein